MKSESQLMRLTISYCNNFVQLYDDLIINSTGTSDQIRVRCAIEVDTSDYIKLIYLLKLLSVLVVSVSVLHRSNGTTNK